MFGSSFSPDNIISFITNALLVWPQEGVKILSRLAVDLPSEIWWVPVLALLALGGSALFDAFKGRVPDPPVLLGLLVVTAARGFYTTWPLAGHYLLIGFAAAITLWAINQLYYNAFQHDALGLGDAKWTALAIAAFGFKPILWAWVVGAWLGLAWLALRALLSIVRQVFDSSAPRSRDFYERLHFAPFLFVGLMAGLYWNYLR